MQPSPDLLEILVCPVPDCRAKLDAQREVGRLTCVRCGRRYPIRDGWIELVPDEALPPLAPATEKP